MASTRARNLNLFPAAPGGDRLRLEKEAWERGYRLVAGVDEAGRGPLAGPVVAAAVILDPRQIIKELDDSKKLKPEQRRKLFRQIRDTALGIGVGIVDHGQIDRLNILNATLEAMRLAVRRLSPPPEFLLVDGNFPVPVGLPQKTVINGDARSLCIAAASIVAKVVRDKKMAYYHKKFPHYNFMANKGYATREHRRAIARHGCCPIHRKTFKGVKEFVDLPPLWGRG